MITIKNSKQAGKIAGDFSIICIGRRPYFLAINFYEKSYRRDHPGENEWTCCMIYDFPGLKRRCTYEFSEDEDDLTIGKTCGAWYGIRLVDIVPCFNGGTIYRPIEDGVSVSNYSLLEETGVKVFISAMKEIGYTSRSLSYEWNKEQRRIKFPDTVLSALDLPKEEENTETEGECEDEQA